MKILVAGVGNVLRSDDGFGVEVANRLLATAADNSADKGGGQRDPDLGEPGLGEPVLGEPVLGEPGLGEPGLGEPDLGENVTVVEAGIAGIQLIQELQDGYDAIVVIDTVDRDRPPGTVMVIDYDVIDVHQLDHNEKYDLLADMHLATPERSLMVARALGVLPPIVRMVGVQPVDVDSPAVGLSDTVARAIEPAIVEIRRCVTELLDQDADRNVVRKGPSDG